MKKALNQKKYKDAIKNGKIIYNTPTVVELSQKNMSTKPILKVDEKLKNKINSKQINNQSPIVNLNKKNAKKGNSSKFDVCKNILKKSSHRSSSEVIYNKKKPSPVSNINKNEKLYASEWNLSKPTSLRNSGLNCYLNSALQGISSCSKFVDAIIDMACCNKDLIKLQTFASLIKELISCSSSTMEISKNAIFRDWNKPGQQDSYELLAHVINQVYTEIRNYQENQKLIEKRNLKQWLLVKLPMRIIMDFVIKCKCGNDTSSPLQSDLAFHVTISKQKKDLQTLFNNYFDEEPIEDYECDNRQCAHLYATRTARLYWPLPDTICVHLQRTYSDSGRMKKIGGKIEFSEFLTVKKKYFKNDNKTASDDHVVDKKYQLVSVIVHYGGVSFGNYVCYKRCVNQWYYTSDSSINKVTWNDVRDCEAYILFYEDAT